MENIETKNFSPDLPDYEFLRQEIADLKVGEMLKKEKDKMNYNPHFDNIDPAVLTTQDLNIYKEYKEGTLSLEKFLDYKKNFRGIENEDDPRLNFMAWLNNGTSAPEWIKKWYPEVYKSHFEGKEFENKK